MTTDAMDFGAHLDMDKAVSARAQSDTSAAEEASFLEELTFREASDELEGIVRLLEGNQLELEDALRSYERGVRLLRELQARLAHAQQQVSVLMGELGPESTDDVDTMLS